MGCLVLCALLALYARSIVGSNPCFWDAKAVYADDGNLEREIAVYERIDRDCNIATWGVFFCSIAFCAGAWFYSTLHYYDEELP